MIRSALILGAVSFLYMLVTSVAQSVCAPLLAIVLGLAAGALAVVFDKPKVMTKAVVSGALAGLLASLGAIAGSVAGLAIRIFAIFGPNTFVDIIPNPSGAVYTQSDLNTGLFVVFCCCISSVFALMAGSGALGGFLGFQLKKPKPAPPPTPSSTI
jgi:hypothetical protein